MFFSSELEPAVSYPLDSALFLFTALQLNDKGISVWPGAGCIKVGRTPGLLVGRSLCVGRSQSRRTPSVGVGWNNHTYTYQWPLPFYAATSPSDVDFTPELLPTSETPTLVQNERLIMQCAHVWEEVSHLAIVCRLGTGQGTLVALGALTPSRTSQQFLAVAVPLSNFSENEEFQFEFYMYALSRAVQRREGLKQLSSLRNSCLIRAFFRLTSPEIFFLSR